MIFIKNTQRTVQIPIERLHEDAKRALEMLGYSSYELNIWITTDKTIRFYNREYRHKDKPTDVLSFPYYPDLKAGERIKPLSDEEKILGDLIISAPYVVREAVKYNVSFYQRLQLLLVHGICHLLGYDHIEDDDFRRMRAKEVAILKKINS